MDIGEHVPDLRITPDRYLPHRYAGASLDFNPIHIDPEAARAAGLPGNVLHGLYTMAVLARSVGELAAGDPSALRSLEVEFTDVAVPGSEFATAGEVTEVADGRASIEASIVQDGTVVVRGRAEMDDTTADEHPSDTGSRR
ncbi:MaoC/PaaZ C-terminal domain-containing protein [Actinomycetospora sp. C-140]